MSRGTRITLLVLGLVLCLLLLLFAAGRILIDHELSRMDRSEGTLNPENAHFDTSDLFGFGEVNIETAQSRDVTNILLIGQDRRDYQEEDDTMRSDAMILCSINKKTKQILLTSLMRDMYLPVPGKGYGQLNSTYMAGGMELLDQTIEQDFGIHIDGNLEVDFYRFIELMDLVGPLEIELTQEEADWLNGNTRDEEWQEEWNEDAGIDNTGWNLQAGVNAMTAEQVADYCRLRVVGKSDWERTERQRTVVMAIFNKLKGEDRSTLLRFVREALPLIRTDMTNRQVIRAVFPVFSKKISSFETFRIPTDEAYTQQTLTADGETLYLLLPDLSANSAALKQKIYGG